MASAQLFLPLALILRIVGLDRGRYHAWRRAESACELADRSSCPRTNPGQLTAAEVATIKDIVLVPDYRHMPLGALATPSAPARSSPRHVDTTVINLLDGTKAYLQAVIDNYARKILAWTVASRLAPSSTCQVLLAAGKHLVSAGRPLLYADSGVENVNSAVDGTLFSACLKRILAQVEFAYSNSMIEAWWRSLKHQWLYMNSLDSLARHTTGYSKRPRMNEPETGGRPISAVIALAASPSLMGCTGSE